MATWVRCSERMPVYSDEYFVAEILPHGQIIKFSATLRKNSTGNPFWVTQRQVDMWLDGVPPIPEG